MKKETTDQSLLGSCCTANSASTIAGTSANTMYYQTIFARTKTKTKTVEIYQINKKGKEVLVGRNVITTTKTKYPKSVQSNPYCPPYTLTSNSPNDFILTDVTAFPNVVTTPTFTNYPNGTNVNYTSDNLQSK